MKNRTRLFCLILTVFAISFTGCIASTPQYGPISGFSPAAPTPAPSFDRARVGVVSFEYTGRWGSNRDLEEVLASELWQTGKFEVVERAQLEQVLREQRLSMSGHIDDRTAVEMGRLLGLNFVVMGRVIEASQEQFVNDPSKSVIPSKWIPREIRSTTPTRQVRVKVRVNIKAIDVTTGAVRFHDTAEATETASADGRFDFSSLYSQAARRAIARLVRKM